MDHMFIYGTLMRGEEREGLLLHLVRIPATSMGRLWRAAAGYPVFEPDGAGVPIHGELVPMDDPALLQMLDLIEGVAGGLYSRSKVDTTSDNGPKQAWTYVMDQHQRRRAGCTPIKATDWRSHRR